MTQHRLRLERAEPGTRWVGFVHNLDDAPGMVSYLAHVATHRQTATEPASRPVVVRPTPGGGDRTAVAFDILTALGKNPETLRGERLGGQGWDLARAWLIGLEITDVVIDRAHELPAERLVELAELTGQVPAVPWMIWSTPDVDAARRSVRTLRDAELRVDEFPPETMIEALPVPDGPPPLPPQSPSWPTLPAADFTTFRAACRRHLGPAAFARIDKVYMAAFVRTDQWLSGRYRQNLLGMDPLPPTLQQIAVPLVGWLRDTQLGPVSDPSTALITLRGTQASLFRVGILLRWSTEALGPDPAGRLPGNLTTTAVGALTAMGRTHEAAATALSLHLNQSPNQLGCLRLADLAADAGLLGENASTQWAPRGHTHEPGPHLDADTGRVLAGPDSDREISCHGPIIVPERARPILRAHRAYRQHEGATGDDKLFVHPRQPTRTPGQILREAAIRTSARLRLNPTWLHRDPCKYGADVGLTPRSQGWLIERGLSLFQLTASPPCPPADTR